VAIKQGINDLLKIHSWVFYINPNEPFGTSILFKTLIWIASWFITLQIVFTDITPPNICELVSKYKHIQFELYDHHHTQKSLVTQLHALNLPNIQITFCPESKFGAAKLLVDKYADMLTEEQTRYFTKIAACDMWNSEEFPDFIYFLFGFNNFCDEYLSGNIPQPHSLWDVSFDGDYLIDSYIKKGKKYYTETEKFLNGWIERNIHSIVINYKDNCKILLVDTSMIRYPYRYSRNTTSVFAHYLNNTKYFHINVLAIYKNCYSEYVSLRAVGDDSNGSYDVSTIAKLCDGGGHKKASGCKLEKLRELLNI
jgi:oligoribonuclease NrnB/cAMP/cGMP phosphodiesterase (DHH superfamily)